jgi:microcystin-dependent protein
MSEPFIGEIRMWGLNFAPKHWAMCDGQSVAINDNQILFALLGTQYGGNGVQTYNLPDFRGRTPVHRGQETYLGGYGGQERVELVEGTMAAHTHSFLADADVGDSGRPKTTTVLAKGSKSMYGSPNTLVDMNPGCIGATENGNQSHENMQPTTVINFCIALQGLFPSRN